MTITLAQAEAVLDGALAEARRRNMPPVSAAVVDAGGHLKAMRREDGCSFLRADVCQAKAYGAVGMGVSSRTLAERYLGDAQQQGLMTAVNAITRGRLVPLPGGVPIADAEGRVLGCVGVAGGPSELDEACAMAGIAAAGLHAVG